MAAHLTALAGGGYHLLSRPGAVLRCPKGRPCTGSHIRTIISGSRMYAVIESGGKQYRVQLGAEIQVDHLEVGAGDSITFDRVLLVADGDTTAIGQPHVDGAVVSADIVSQDRGDKIVVFKYRPKARRRVKKGFRAALTTLRISDITYGGQSAAEAAAHETAQREQAGKVAQEAAARKAAADQALAAKLAAEAEETAKGEEAAQEPGSGEGTPGGPKRAAASPKAPKAKAVQAATDEISTAEATADESSDDEPAAAAEASPETTDTAATSDPERAADETGTDDGDAESPSPTRKDT
ncbi:hypothetical protein BH24CHL9_BH24CHL9_05040 [soil metagenome]